MLLHDVFGKTLRDHWRSVLGWGLGLAAVAALEFTVYPGIRDRAEEMNRLVAGYPEAFKAMFVLGGDFTSGPGFLTAELFTVMIPLVMLSLGIGMGAGATAGEEQEHTIDLLLANPLSRRRVVVEKFLAVLAALAAVGAMLCGVLWVGASLLDMGIGIGRLAAATAGAVLLGAAFAAVALAVGCTTGRKPVAVGVAVALALTGFLVNSLAPMVEAFQPWRKLTLFYQYIGADPLRHGLPAGHAAVLAAVTVAAAAAAVAGFARRDLGT